MERFESKSFFVAQDARHAAEGEIYTKLNQKIDEFIQLADYEWSMAESDGRASGYLMDLINFLRSTFQVFTHLPVSPASVTASLQPLAALSLCILSLLDIVFYPPALWLLLYVTFYFASVLSMPSDLFVLRAFVQSWCIVLTFAVNLTVAAFNVLL